MARFRIAFVRQPDRHLRCAGCFRAESHADFLSIPVSIAFAPAQLCHFCCCFFGVTVSRGGLICHSLRLSERGICEPIRRLICNDFALDWRIAERNTLYGHVAERNTLDWRVAERVTLYGHVTNPNALCNRVSVAIPDPGRAARARRRPGAHPTRTGAPPHQHPRGAATADAERYQRLPRHAVRPIV